MTMMLSAARAAPAILDALSKLNEQPRGELRLKQGQIELAEGDFSGAIAFARRMAAKSYELGGATSLARLFTRQGRRDEARTMLDEIYNWFTEGFDTADLKEAKALLDELNA